MKSPLYLGGASKCRAGDNLGQPRYFFSHTGQLKEKSDLHNDFSVVQLCGHSLLRGSYKVSHVFEHYRFSCCCNYSTYLTSAAREFPLESLGY